jgi:hypothetical protein
MTSSHWGRTFASLLGVLTVLFGVFTALPAVADDSVQPYDPSPYCRPHADAPYATGYYANGIKGKYDLYTRGDVGVSCNGSAYKVYIVAVFHAHTSPALSSDGISSGSSASCSGSCDAHVNHSRIGLSCNTPYAYEDYVQITGYWQRYSTSAKVNISLDGPVTKGSSYFPKPVCG